MSARGRPRIDFGTYLEQSRDVAVSLCLVLPLWLAYEAMVAIAGARARRDGPPVDLLAHLGPSAWLVLLFLAGAFGWAVFAVAARKRPVLRLAPPFLVEALLYALLLHPVIALLSGASIFGRPVPAHGSLHDALLASLGAGIYEELAFRLVLLGGTYLLLARAVGWGRGSAFVVAVVFSAAVFAAWHHAGVQGEPYRARAFFFRWATGILLGVVFALRGLGIAVYLHSFYDVIFDLRGAAWQGD